MNITMIVAAHKPYQMPADKMYLPVQVGAAGKDSIGYQRDDEGENISLKNPNYCELTGLYWAWKNLQADYIGLCHYRRYFKGNRHSQNKFEQVLTKAEAEKLLKKTDVILPQERNYIIETVQSHYAHTHYEKDIALTREAILKLYPSYISEFDTHMKSRNTHICNMFIMRKDLFDKYCDFLFNILFEVEKNADISEYDPFQARVFGRLSEMLLDVWLNHNRISYEEVPMLNIGKTKWVKKAVYFLRAKCLHIKYKQSF